MVAVILESTPTIFKYLVEYMRLNPVLVLKVVKDVKKCDFFNYIIGKSIIKAFQQYAQLF